MKTGKLKLIVTIILSFASFYSVDLHANDKTITPLKTKVEATYLLTDAPTFNETIPVFREQFNLNNPNLPLKEYKVISSKDITEPYIRAANKINNSLYSSAVLERGSEKIKSLQLTLLPNDSEQENALNRKIAGDYIKAMIIHFEPTFKTDNIDAALQPITEKDILPGSYVSYVGAIRYVLVVGGENDATFAIEPIKLSLFDDKVLGNK